MTWFSLSKHKTMPATTVSTTSLQTSIPYSVGATELAAAISSGSVLVSRDTIALASSASATDGYYNNYIIKVTRINPATGRKRIQERRIISYVGATRIATVDDIWEPDFYPIAGDGVEIYPPYRDKRTSINPAMQTMDYITSVTYGRGLDAMKDLDIPSWLETARYCDGNSDITLNISSGTLPAVGKIYRYPFSGAMLWQGTVSATTTGYVEFTNVIGKLTNKWNNWKTFPQYALIYNGSVLYQAQVAGSFPTEPVHTTGTVNNLLALTTLTLDSTNSGPTLTAYVDGNPIRALKNNIRVPGYSLYDCDEVSYWRLLGWDDHAQRYATRYQVNASIDTSQPLFDNINSLLNHFGGILRYSGDKYYLEVEQPAGAISNNDAEVRNITADHIIDKIRLNDNGSKNAFNSLTASFADPANKFEARNVSFFNSNYLRIDKNVPKKGNLSLPGITNYYNTRLIADSFLNKSRYGLTVSFNMAPRGALLLAGQVVQLQYPRYNWTDKKFRITSLSHQPDCTVDIVAEEYDDSFYEISSISKQPGSGSVGTAVVTTIDAPTGLHATSSDGGDENYSNVEITWVNNPNVSSTKNVYTELYSSSSTKMFLTITNIASNVITTSVAHELVEGEVITAQTTGNGLVKGKKYFVKAIGSATTFTVSDTKTGAVLGLTNGSGLSLSIMTANLIATLPLPTNKFIDTFGGIDGRVVKYYWIRHKVIGL